MIFSSPTFLYYFLPITMIVYFLTPMPRGSPRLRNLTLLVASLVFYAWGEPIYVLLMIAQCLVAWGFSFLINKYRNQKAAARAVMIISVIVILSALLFFKYANFFINIINSISRWDLKLISLALPIGISFYTFQFISYTVDLYKGKIELQRNLLDFSTYVALFPQLVAGPIVRYSDINIELGKREHTISRFAIGARRFVVGLGKKMLLANTFGELVAIYKQSGDQSVLFTWIYLVAYSLQIYFDFSGYSDMAIGLGHFFGFKFPENFNYPYIADSITNFWRRWHMSLSGWFRDYIYIPMGGNRVKALRFVLNILVVWMLTGFWHGADWNFIFWGAYFGLVLLIEKFFLSKVLEKTPKPLRHIYVMLIIFISWAFFDTDGFNVEAIVFAFKGLFGGRHSVTIPKVVVVVGSSIGRMFGFGASGFAGREALYYLRSYAVPIVIGILGATPYMRRLGERVCTKRFLGTVLEPVALGLILVATTASMVEGSFNPFIYFRF